MKTTGELHPEDAATLINDLLKEMVDALTKFDGRIDRFLGDGVLALSYALVRTVSFMMVDGLGYPFLRGDLECQMDGWMLRRQFWLGLPKDTDPAFLLRIIGDEIFSGNPPTLTVEKAESRPDWNVYYHITLSSGTGTTWGPGHSEQAALKTIETVIKASAEMYEESMVEGFSNMADVERFLTTAYQAFEAY